MWRTILKLSLRNILNHKLFTLINIMGLAIGLTSSLLIMLHVSHELSYDTNWKRAVDHAKSVGLSKIAGAVNNQLVARFITEAVITNCLVHYAWLVSDFCLQDHSQSPGFCDGRSPRDVYWLNHSNMAKLEDSYK